LSDIGGMQDPPGMTVSQNTLHRTVPSALRKPLEPLEPLEPLAKASFPCRQATRTSPLHCDSDRLNRLRPWLGKAAGDGGRGPRCEPVARQDRARKGSTQMREGDARKARKWFSVVHPLCATIPPQSPAAKPHPPQIAPTSITPAQPPTPPPPPAAWDQVSRPSAPAAAPPTAAFPAATGH